MKKILLTLSIILTLSCGYSDYELQRAIAKQFPGSSVYPVQGTTLYMVDSLGTVYCVYAYSSGEIYSKYLLFEYKYCGKKQ